MRPLLVSSLLLYYLIALIEERSHTPEPYTSDPRLLTALLSPNDLGSDWFREPVGNAAERESVACSRFSLFSEGELDAVASVELAQDLSGKDPRWLNQTVLVAPSELLARSRMRTADAVAQCSQDEEDGVIRFDIERFELPGAGDDSVGIRYTELEPDEPRERPFVGHKVLIRSGRVIGAFFLGRFDRAPTLAETADVVELVRERLEAYERRMKDEWSARPADEDLTEPGSLPAIEALLPDLEDIEPLLAYAGGDVFGSDGSSQDQIFPTSRGFMLAEYRHFRSPGDFYEYTGTCAEFVNIDDASMALGRSVLSLLSVVDNPYSVERVNGIAYRDESTVLAGTVVRGDEEYPVAIVLLRSNTVTCRYVGFTVESDPLEQVTELVERTLATSI